MFTDKSVHRHAGVVFVGVSRLAACWQCVSGNAVVAVILILVGVVERPCCDFKGIRPQIHAKSMCKRMCVIAR